MVSTVNVLLFLSILCGVACLDQPAAPGIIGYDCSHPSGGLSTISLTRVLDCEKIVGDIKEEIIEGQIIQLKDHIPVQAYSCLLEIDRDVSFCSETQVRSNWGSHWSNHQSPVAGGKLKFIQPLGKDKCHEIHRTKFFKFGNVVFDHLNGNSTSTRSAVLSGHLDQHGGCKNGGDYADIGIEVSNKLVTAVVTLRIRDFTSYLDKSGQSLTHSALGLTCQANEEYCFDSQFGEVVWTIKAQGLCHSYGVDVLYMGPMTIITDTSGELTSNLVRVNHNTKALALTLTGTTYMCNQLIYKTEQERIYLIKKTSGGYFFREGTIDTHNLDLTAYFNTKFLLTEIQTGLRMTDLYQQVMYENCLTRKITLENRLALAKISPHQISQLVEGGFGVFGRVMGEVLYITKCIPIMTTHRHTSQCYQELPVYYGNKSEGYILPITHILSTHGTLTTCSTIMAPMFQIGSLWVSRNPLIQEKQAPQFLNPNSKNQIWKFNTMKSLGIAGLYSLEDMKKLQIEMMFPVTREAVTSDMVRTITHGGSNQAEYGSLLSPNEINTLASRVGERLSWFFKVLGQWTSTILGIVILWKLLMYLLGVVMNCIIIHRSGLSKRYYITSLVDSLVTWFTVHLPKQRVVRQNEIPLIPSQAEEQTQTSLSTPSPSPSPVHEPMAWSSPHPVILMPSGNVRKNLC